LINLRTGRNLLFHLFWFLSLSVASLFNPLEARANCGAILFTNVYGQPGTFGLFIEDTTNKVLFSTMFSISPANGTYLVDTSSLPLNEGSTYILGFYTVGYTPIGAPFSNWSVTLDSSFQFTTGQPQTQSGFLRNPNTEKLPFTVVNSCSPIPPQAAAQLHLQNTESAINQLFSIVRAIPGNASLSEHQIAEQAFSAVVDARNGFYGLSNDFQFLKSLDLVTISNVDHYSQAYAVSTGNNPGEGQIAGFVFGVIVDPVYNIGKAIAQTFGSNFLATGVGPQSPANFDFWALAGAKAAFNNLPPGQPPNAGTDLVPLQPVSTGNNASVFVQEPLLDVLYTLDPIQSSGFTYFVLSGPLFSSITVPRSSIPNDTSIKLFYAGKVVSLSPDQTYTFDSPVNIFSIEGIDFSGTNSHFISKVSFVATGTSAIAQVSRQVAGPSFGDLNGDGVVNCLDLDLVRTYFGKNYTQPGFDPRADVNLDGVVNVLDLSAVARQLPAGTACH
jgi:hypothetical protein